MKKVIVFGMSVVLLWSCNNSTEKSTAHQETENHAGHHHEKIQMLLNSTMAKNGL